MDLMANQEIIRTKEEGIVTITLNRPDKLNAITEEMVRQFPGIIEEIRMDDSIKVVIITGAGRGFCAGADASRLVSSISGERLERTRRELTTPIGYWLLPLAKLEKPTIAAINGVVAGVGISVALACDIRIASEHATFTAAWVKRGLIPDGGATYFLPRVLGMSKALELMFTGDMVNAVEAERIGLVSRVVPHDDLLRVVHERASTIAKGPSVAIELMKKGAYRSLNHDLESQLDFESYAQNICRQTEDHKEGVESFIQKRPPKFEGR